MIGVTRPQDHPGFLRQLRQALLSRSGILTILLLAELGTFGAALPGYLTIDGLLDATATFAGTGVMALGMTFVIISGGIDLSVASLLALVAVTIGLTFKAGLPLPLAMFAGLVAGLAGGLVNGAAVAILRLHPFVVTLATMALFRGMAYAISNARAVSRFPGWFTDLGQYDVFGTIPVQFPIFVAAALVCSFVLARTRFGRHVYGVGANELAMRFSGVAVVKTKIAVYVISGFLVSVAAVIETARASTARANAAMGLELPVIAMVVLGGTEITGGVGTVVGTVLGVAIISYLEDGLAFAEIRSDWGLVVVGFVLIAGVLANQIGRGKR